MFTGHRTARWAFGFVERCFIHPESIARAKLRHNPPPAIPSDKPADPSSWRDWFGWGPTERGIANLSNILIGVNTPAKKSPERVWEPTVAATSQPKTLDGAYAQLNSML